MTQRNWRRFIAPWRPTIIETAFLVRPGVMAAVAYPEDLSAAEAERLCAMIRALVLEESTPDA